jgi:hypothetical protein
VPGLGSIGGSVVVFASHNLRGWVSKFARGVLCPALVGIGGSVVLFFWLGVKCTICSQTAKIHNIYSVLVSQVNLLGLGRL